MASFLAAFENVEQLVARTVTEAASAVVESTNEFPKPQTAEQTRAGGQHALKSLVVVPVSTTHAAAVAQRAQSSWEDFDWQVLLAVDGGWGSRWCSSKAYRPNLLPALAVAMLSPTHTPTYVKLQPTPRATHTPTVLRHSTHTP